MRKFLWAYGIALLVSGCGSSIGDVCQMEADCWQKRCNDTDAACEARAAGRYDACVAEADAWESAILTGDDDKCGKCVDATEELWACMAEQKSCDAFDNATNADGACASESVSARNKCDNIETTCGT